MDLHTQWRRTIWPPVNPVDTPACGIANCVTFHPLRARVSSRRDDACHERLENLAALRVELPSQEVAAARPSRLPAVAKHCPVTLISDAAPPLL